MTRLQRCVFLLGWLFVTASFAQEPSGAVAADPRYVADIELETEDDLSELLTRAGEMFLEGTVKQEQGAVVLVLHGPVLNTLLRPNYAESQAVVNQAASLAALGVLEIKACRSWLGKNGVDASQLQPFVEVVSYGPGEVSRLVEDEGYIFF
ncbi:MAG: hypothetical protein ABJN62_00475 [Halioglobus sp.]